YTLLPSSLHSVPLHRALHSFPTRRSSDLPPSSRWSEWPGSSSAANSTSPGWCRRGRSDHPPRSPDNSSTWPPSGSRASRRHRGRSEEHTSELQSHLNLVCRLLLEKKNKST